MATVNIASQQKKRIANRIARLKVLAESSSSHIMRTMAHGTHPTLPALRSQLASVAASARPLVDVSTASAVLGWDRRRTAKQLARWSSQGFLRRVRRGTYAIVPTGSMTQEQVIADPWVLIPATFRRAYIGGWSAAQHWDLTEQIFQTLFVCTADRVRRTQLTVAGTSLRVRHVPESWFFATNVEWREGSRVLVSDVHKTVLDLCADPAIGGGIQHVMHCLRSYLARDDFSIARLLEYAKRLAIPTAYKRLGFLCEVAHGPIEVIEECRRSVTAGLAALDPALKSPKIAKRWQLRLPAAWERVLSDD
jgi:predicted transcriptional regulator of viral defense system